MVPRRHALQRLATGVSDNAVWSPDGRQIAYSGLDPLQPNPAYAIFRMNADGGRAAQVTTTPDGDSVTDWQPIPASRRSDYKNAAKLCKAEQSFWGDQFASHYGGGKNAFGKCVSGK